MHKTKNGTAIEIREISIDEAQSLIELKLSYLRNTKSIPLYVDEYKNSVVDEKALIRSYHDDDNSVLLVASIEGELVGNIDLAGSKRRKMAHTASIGMGIKKQHQNKGIGSLLLQEVIMWTKEKSSLEIIWLEVYSDNLAGISLYQKFGFKTCGTISRFFKNKQDQYIDKIQMVLHI